MARKPKNPLLSMCCFKFAKAVDSGILSYEFGEVWWSLLPHLAAESPDLPGSWQQRGLQALKQRLHSYYRETAVDSRLPLRRLSLRTLKCKKAPKLRAKAGQARRLVQFTANLAEEFQGRDGELGLHRHLAMSNLQALCGLANKPELNAQDMAQRRWTSAVHMYHYAHCGFAVYPKFHHSMHMPEQVERGGVPKTFSVYSHESKNREAKLIWNACSKGWSVCQQVLLRMEWLWALKALELKV